MMTKAESKHLANVISENSDTPRRLWSTEYSISAKKTEFRSKINVFERATEDDIKKANFVIIVENHVIWTPFLKSCRKIVLTY